METINLKKMFNTQNVLRDRIGYNEPDRFYKLVLALSVELGECANEWRGFKFWSKNQEPRTKAIRVPAMMEEDKEYYNPLLEEYVDGWHFVLELGLELAYTEVNIVPEITRFAFNEETIDEQFLTVYENAISMKNDDCYFSLVNSYLALGEMLGFTWGQIEQAYFEKNKINHQRQESGY